MPEYRNPELPEEVNNSDRRPLASFFALSAAALAAFGVAALALVFFGGELARHLPYETEMRLIAPHAERYPPRDHPVERYLQRLADRLASGMSLPPPMAIRVHYVNEPVVNAFATLGGHIAVYRGLLERMPDENALAMVLAHEIGHARHRHPVQSLGRGVAFGAALSVLSAGAGGGVAEGVLGKSGMLTLLSFSRAQEDEADDAGLDGLALAYGHAGGAADTFRMLREAAGARGRSEPPVFLSTHPLTQARIDRIAGAIARRGAKADGPRTAIPEEVRRALETDATQTTRPSTSSPPTASRIQVRVVPNTRAGNTVE